MWVCETLEQLEMEQMGRDVSYSKKITKRKNRRLQAWKKKVSEAESEIEVDYQDKQLPMKHIWPRFYSSTSANPHCHACIIKGFCTNGLYHHYVTGSAHPLKEKAGCLRLCTHALKQASILYISSDHKQTQEVLRSIISKPYSGLEKNLLV